MSLPPNPKTPNPKTTSHETLAGVPDDNLRRATGTDWAGWLARIGAWGGADRTHAEIAAWVGPQVQNDEGKALWWAQAITVGYERLIGRRLVGQTCTGTWAASKSVTVTGDLDTVRTFLHDSTRFPEWAPAGLELRPTTSKSSVRYTTAEGNTAAIWLTAKPGPRCTVGLQVDGLPSAEARDATKAVWAVHLNLLKTCLA